MTGMRRVLVLMLCLAALGVFAARTLGPIRPAIVFSPRRILTPIRLAVELVGLDGGAGYRGWSSDPRIVDMPPRYRGAPLAYAVQSQTRTAPQPYVYRRPIFRLGQDYTLRAGDEVRQLTVVSGNVTIEGHVTRDVFVVLGDVHLASTAVVDGSIVVTAGNVTAASGATVHQDLVVVGGTVDGPPDFSPEREHIAIGATPLGDWLRSIVPWVTRGLLFGRPIVPDVGWVWGIVGVFFLLSLALTLVFDRQVRACATVVVDRPVAAILAGLIVLVLMGPMFLIVAATVVGIAVIPFIACAVAVGWMLGKIGVVRGLGSGLVHQHDPESRPQSVRSFVVGFAAICLAYMVPVLGFVVWAMIGVIGLGAATITFLGALRREPKPAPAGRAPETPPEAPGSASGSVMPEGGWSSAPGPEPAASAFVHEPSAYGSAGADAGRAAAFEPAPAPPSSPPDIGPAPAAVPGASYATFLDRLAAFVLDCLLLAVANGFLRFARADGPLLLWLLIYHIGFWAWMGTTMGGIIVGIKVVRADGGTLRPVDAVVRALASLFSLVALGIGCLWMLQDPERQMWHDKIAGTHVVKVPRNLLLA